MQIKAINKMSDAKELREPSLRSMKLILFVLSLIIATDAHAQTSSYGNAISVVAEPIARILAEHNRPTEVGAMGRNKHGYFHVRFQLGMHYLANYGLVTKQSEEIETFITAAEYSYRFQLESGGFKLILPRKLSGQGTPSLADRVSGVAFFASSIGSGIYALETSDWFQKSSQHEKLQKRITLLKPKLRSTLEYLLQNQEYLKAADRHAPNRLLFDGLAFYSLGKILNNEEAISVAESFVGSAAKQVHENGYFIENGGFDSSYNGVAVALGLRLLMMGYEKDQLDTVCQKAIMWQRDKISDTGEIITVGNTRVNPHGGGESFLGRVKDVDVGHTVEAFLLASQWLENEKYTQLAEDILKYYLKRR